MSIRHNSKGKIIPRRFTLEQIEGASENMVGLCLACGAERECCEPDARKYHCEECGRNSVYGAEEILLMGYVEP